ncbi:phospho-N-acetylmuramoyl-pentapeptide-transferase [Methanothermobacter tenebrarum]|jgi:phospho-N-acetylmuramoyl-pentapeptide-transferase|uniref:Phospho-N-acetylmuramoyl-pentapeptide-transferase n=1 Tax=Methanothermobacter tenebrarum TaxID=680118 RepID=A0ABN6PB48_9EURY|nr:glycosyltransferase family 4 protein [Methanothermobacter tenebrarum]MDD3454899.1 glycosyltransferase family 4 protein [Methanobacteriales archaeon]MDI6881620.1 glycosyltransferase family 4 protein [Methanothermobacter sp.]MDX9693538.1 glycosyltransferase family 4 protein [Methanothermobacter sp.]BDH79409.1 phospho-N-acetylmuramoyl-pentapeptide-transferase [Methanothermobacter tenebrarum]HOQ19503.1 glycosyltransferase family 4 protein [Methanothermobacter sp.]
MIPRLMEILITTIILSVIFTFFVRKTLKEAQITDKPIVTEHKHKTGTPTMGGLGMLLAIISITIPLKDNLNLVITTLIVVASALIGLLDDLLGLRTKEVQKIIKNISNRPVEIGRLILKPGEEARVATPKARADFRRLKGKGLISVVGEAPIKYEIRERDKIIVQCLPGALLVLSGAVTSLGGLQFGMFMIPVIVFGVIGAINAVNLIDGMDGMAAGIMAIASASCALFLYLSSKPMEAVPFIVLAGSSLGFLVFNRHPASIFMGDTGSFALGGGYAAAVILTDTVYFGVLALTVPIVSVIISLLHRAHIIRLPVEPLHHTLHYKGLSEKSIVLLYWLVTLIICAIGLYFRALFPTG